MRLFTAFMTALWLGSSACAGGVASLRAPAPAGFVNGPSGRLRVDDGGTGSLPVVFVHGLAGDHHQWDEALRHVRAHRRALALDLHGMGESAPSPAGDYSIESFAADLAAVVDQAKLERFVLVGHSLGGTVATAYAAAHPGRVAGILYVDPSPDLSGQPRALLAQLEASVAPAAYPSFSSAFYDGLLESAQPGTRQRVVTALRDTPQPVFAGAFVALLHYDARPALRAYRGPRLALVTRGNDEPGSIHRLVPGIEHSMIDGVSHWLMIDRPGELARALDGFLPRCAR